jgi:hypothetical protein
MSEPVTLTFIFQTIGIILAVTAVSILFVLKNSRSKTSKKEKN